MQKVGKMIRRLGPVALGVLLLGMLALPSAALAAVVWGGDQLGPLPNAYTWNHTQPGSSWTDNGGTTLLHTAFVNDGPPWKAKYTCDPTGAAFAGDFMKVYYANMDTSVGFYNPRMALSPSNMNAERPSLATLPDGTIFVGWVTQQCYYDYYKPFPSLPRQFQARISGNHGTSFGPAFTLTGRRKMIDFPYVESNGVDTFFAAFTNAKSGFVKVARIDGSGLIDKTNVGDTTAHIDEWDVDDGLSGQPAVAAVGDEVMVSWIDNKNGRVVAITSDDGGDTWSAETEIAAAGALDDGGMLGAGANRDIVGSAGLADPRLGLAWTDDNGGYYQEFDPITDTWGPMQPFAGFPDGLGHPAGNQPSVDLFGAGQVGISYSACTLDGCDTWNDWKTVAIDVLFVESTDNGATFSAPTSIGTSTGPKTNQAFNYESNFFWFDGTTRYVFWNINAYNDYEYKVIWKKGTGAYP